jgi:hypothetical protein
LKIIANGIVLITIWPTNKVGSMIHDYFAGGKKNEMGVTCLRV